MTDRPTIAPVVTGPRRAVASSAAARALVLKVLSRLDGGAVIVRESGRQRLYGRPVPGEIVPEVEVRSPALYRALLAEASAGLGRAWFSDYFDCPDSDQLVALLRILDRNLDRLGHAASARSLLGRAERRLVRRAARSGNRDVDKANIVAHYDLGNDFYQSFLDETMTYSCAIFANEDTSLRDAQIEKLDRLCRKLSLSAHDHVLEIGTGWGSFALHAASHYGCQVTTTTISDRQYELASARVKEAGLEDRVDVLSRDYRDLTGSYDKLVSIEMIEALDWRQYPTYFSACAKLLKDDGLMAFQAITIADRYYEQAKYAKDFIKTYIFPGSNIPSVGAITTHATDADLTLVDLEDIGAHYAKTLSMWRKRLEENESELAALGADEALQRLYRFYFAYCEAGFTERRISDVQCVFAKKDWRPAGLSLIGA